MIIIHGDVPFEQNVEIMFARMNGAVVIQVTDHQEETVVEVPLTREEIQALRQFFDEEGL